MIPIQLLAWLSAAFVLSATTTLPIREGTSAPPPEKKVGYWVTAYYGTWSEGGGNPMYPHQINWKGITHIIHFGANSTKTYPYFTPLTVPDDSVMLVWGGLGLWNKDFRYRMIDSLRIHGGKAGARVLLSCGGIYGDGAAAMSHILSDSSRAQVFVNAVSGFAKRHRYHGIEIDWEPVFGTEPESRIRQKISLLTRLFRRELDTWNPRGILVIATAYGVEGRYDPALQQMVDQYNIMNYDMHATPSWSGKDLTGLNAPLSSPKKELSHELFDSQYSLFGRPHEAKGTTGITAMISQGIAAQKVGCGLPFYGFVYIGNDAPGQQRKGHPQYISYRQALKTLEHGGVRRWEEGAQVPWIGGIANSDMEWPLPKKGERFYITYDDTTSLRLKIDWAKQMNVGGFMIFDLWRGWDASAPPAKREPLLDAVRRSLSGGVRPN